MTKAHLLKQVAALCESFEDGNGNRVLVFCEVQIENKSWGFNGERMLLFNTLTKMKPLKRKVDK